MAPKLLPVCRMHLPRDHGKATSTIAVMLALLVTLSSSCAQVKHAPVSTFEGTDGIPYYLGSWYLLVHADGRGGLKSQLLYLMDPRRRMNAQPRAWFASLDTLLKLDGGVLTRAETTVDTTAVPTAILKAAEKAAGMLVANAPETTEGVRVPSIFRVDVKPPTVPDGPTIVTFVGEISTLNVEVF